LKQNRLEFLEYLKNSDMTIDGATVSYRGKVVCYMHMDDGTDYPSPWTIWTDGDYSMEHKGVPLSGRMKEIAWENVNKCDNCGNGCTPGTNKAIFGKRFDGVCGASMAFYIPQGETMECIKILLEIRKQTINAAK